MPRAFQIGDFVRCNRCKLIFEVKLCGSCDEHHPKPVDVPAHVVCDHDVELCALCATPEELYVANYHNHQRSEHGALPN